LQDILPTQIANNIATTEKSENQLQVLDFIEVEQSKTVFGVELGGSIYPQTYRQSSVLFYKSLTPTNADH